MIEESKKRAVTRAFILGLGLSGQAAATLLLDLGYRVFGYDDKLQKKGRDLDSEKEGLKKEIELGDEAALRQADLFVVSPGIAPDHPFYRLARELALEEKLKIVGEVELALSYLKDKKILAISGTNGKTTVTSLVSHMLNACGIAAKAVGNIGLPLSAYVAQHLREGSLEKEEVIVLELSSYQLETLKSASFSSTALLNITADHLDRYESFQAYAQVKASLFKFIKEKGPCFILDRTLAQFPFLFPQKVTTFGFGQKAQIAALGQKISLGGQTYLAPPSFQGEGIAMENLLAALALAASCGAPIAGCLEAAATFNKPPHRLEFVRQINGIDYINDSKGTNIDATLRAVEGLKGPVILIAGGVHKGASYRPWLAFQGKVLHLIAIGQAAPLIAAELEDSFPITLAANLQEAVLLASNLASQVALQPPQKGSVLLSPGCASYDQFQDYAERGDTFKKIVNTLLR